MSDVRFWDCAHIGTLSIHSVFGDFSTALILQSDIRFFSRDHDPDVQHMLDPSSMSVLFFVLARTKMKAPAKCDKHCELQDSVNQKELESILLFGLFLKAACQYRKYVLRI